ncbi:MAG TPA: hypothetical protein VM487_03215 [Phycisphaerae bacterium]|nr:hypothetical protein [Phycisphaerae bacterium]
MRRIVFVGCFLLLGCLSSCIDNSAWIRIAEPPLIENTQPASDQA